MLDGLRLRVEKRHCATTAQPRLRHIRHRKRKRGRGERVHGIAALREDRGAGRGGIGVRGGDHAAVALHALPGHRRHGSGQGPYTAGDHRASDEQGRCGNETSGAVERETCRQRHALR